MFSHFSRTLYFSVILALLLCLPAFAEDFSNTINSVKVESVGDKSVVVDVYINSKDENIKPKLSSRKYTDDKYVIDLMEVTQQGNVTKDTSASKGLINSKDIKVGKLPGGTARVLIDLEDPGLEVKEVRYHMVKAATKNAAKPITEKVQKTSKSVNTPKQTKTVSNKPKKASKNTLSLLAESTKYVKDKQPLKKISPKPSQQPVNKVINSVNIANSSQKDEAKSSKTSQEELTVTQPQQTLSDKSKEAFGPVIIHKTDNAVKPSKVEEPKSLVAKNINQKEEASTSALKPAVEIEKKSTNNSSIQQQPAEKNIKNVNKLTKPEVTTSVHPRAPLLKQNTGRIKELPPENIHISELKKTNTSANKALIVQANPKNPKIPAKTVEAKNVDPEQTPLNIDASGEENLKVVDVQDKEIDFLGLLLTLVGALVIVIPLIFVAIWVINMFYKGGDSMSLKTLASSSGSKFKILASTSLGQGKSIHLVEIRGRQLVIGSTNNSINILTEFDDFDQFVEENQAKDFLSQKPELTKKFKRGRAPLGSFADLYKDYTANLNDEDLEDEY